MTEFADAIQDETIDTDPPLAEERDTYFEAVEVQLSDEAKDEKRKRLETVDREIIRLEEEKKANAKVFSDQLKPLKAERESILGVLDSGTEKQQVECYEHFDDRLGKVEIRRVDTDEVVEERAMTAEERNDAAQRKQGDLFASSGSSNPPPSDSEDDEETFEPTPEALAQAAEDTGAIVRTSAAEARKRKQQRANGAAKDAE